MYDVTVCRLINKSELNKNKLSELMEMNWMILCAYVYIIK